MAHQGAAFGIGLVANLIERFARFLPVLVPDLLCGIGGQEAGLEELLLEIGDAVALVDAPAAGGAGVTVEPAHVPLEAERPTGLADVANRLLEREVGGFGVVAVHHRPANAIRDRPLGQVLERPFLARGGADAELVVADEDQDWQLLSRPRAPDQAGLEVALGRARVAAVDDADAAPTLPLLDPGRPGSHGVLNLDGRRHRHDVPIAHRVVIHEVAAARIGVGGGGPHLPDRVDDLGPHRDQDSARAVVEVQIVVLGALALVDLQPERDTPSFFARSTNPEVAVAELRHGDELFFHDPGLHHQVMHPDSQFVRDHVASGLGGRSNLVRRPTTRIGLPKAGGGEQWAKRDVES